MSRTKMYNRRCREEQIEKIHEMQIKSGHLIVVTSNDENGHEIKAFKNRTIIQVLDSKIKNGNASKKSVLMELRKRLKCEYIGAKERARVENAIKYFGGKIEKAAK